MKVLIVDDDLRNIFALNAVLRAKGIDSLSASSVTEGLTTLARNLDIDVVLLDIMMPEIDGFEAIRRMRHDEETRNIPVIAVTAKAMDGDKEKCIEAGADDYLSKPVDINSLMTLLAKYVNRSKPERAKAN